MSMQTHQAHTHANEADVGMQMWFYNGFHVTLWFKEWTFRTSHQYYLGLVALVCFGVLHEALACYRANQLNRILHNKEDETPYRYRSRVVTRDKLVLAGLYFLNIVTGYLLMLAVMTYNVGYFLAVPLGMSIGYVLFFDETSNAAGLSRGDSCHMRLLDGDVEKQ